MSKQMGPRITPSPGWVVQKLTEHPKKGISLQHFSIHVTSVGKLFKAIDALQKLGLIEEVWSDEGKEFMKLAHIDSSERGFRVTHQTIKLASVERWSPEAREKFEDLSYQSATGETTFLTPKQRDRREKIARMRRTAERLTRQVAKCKHLVRQNNTCVICGTELP